MAVVFVVVLAILQLAVLGIVLAGARNSDLTSRRAEAMRSFYAADTAVNLAIREVQLNDDIDGDGVIGGIATSTLGGSQASVTAAAAGDEFTLIANGNNGMAARRLRAVVHQSGGVSTARGLKAEIWLPSGSLSSLSQVPWSSTPAYAGILPEINFPSQSNSTRRFAGMPTSLIGMRLTGQIRIPAAGAWTFTLGSDDGADLWIDGVRVINHDGLHSYSTRTGAATLTEGLHALEVRFFENTGSNGLVLSWQGPGVAVSTVVPASAFSTDATMPALVGHSTMYLYGDNSSNATTIDAYNSGIGAYGGSNVLNSSAVAAINSTTANAWAMSGNATLRGSALVPPGGTPSSIIATWNSSSITGSRTAAASRTAVFVLNPPATMPASSGAVTMWSGTWNISSNIRTGNVTIGGTSTANVNGTVIARIDGDLTVQDDASFNLLTGADLTIYLSGRLNVWGRGQFNSNTAQASRLKIYMTGTSSDVQISDQGRLSAHILNPGGRLLVYPQGAVASSFAGRFAGNGVQTSDKAAIHLDMSGSSGGSGGTTGSNVSITEWSAVAP